MKLSTITLGDGTMLADHDGPLWYVTDDLRVSALTISVIRFRDGLVTIELDHRFQDVVRAPSDLFASHLNALRHLYKRTYDAYRAVEKRIEEISGTDTAAPKGGA